MYKKRFQKPFVTLLLFLFFAAAYITATHIHKQKDHESLHHHCDVCIITHHFLACDITPHFHEVVFSAPLFQAIPYPQITYHYTYLKYIQTQAPPTPIF